MQTRNSSVEILRIILMVMIVIWYLSVHGYGIIAASNAIPQTQFASYYIFNVYTCCAVNCFMFISGFYGLKFKFSTLLGYMIQCYFYSILLSIIISFFIIETNTIDQVLSRILFPFTNENWWFASGYLMVYLMSPLINQYIEISSVKRMIVLVASMYLLFLLYSAFDNSWAGSINLLFIYVCGRCLQKYPLIFLKKKCISIFLLTTSILQCGVIIGLFLQIPYIGFLYRYWNPLVILSSISLFYCFQSRSIYSKNINTIAKCMFGVYLITDFPPIRYYLNPYMAEVNNSFLAYTIISALFITFTAGIFEYARQKLIQPFIEVIAKYYRSL